MLDKITSLQSQIGDLHGQIDILTHNLQQAQDAQRKMAVDVDSRLAALANKAAVTTVSPEPVEKPVKNGANNPVSKQPSAAQEAQIYKSAYGYIKAKNFDQAAKTFQDMLHQYPSGQFAANAHYWLGEIYTVQTKPDQAIAEFSKVIAGFPGHPKVADAQLKIGIIYSSQGKWNESRIAFKKVISHFPGTSSARLAAEQIKQMKQAGHDWVAS